jgi:isoquinoline 1-oxidoreductase beta subunit
MAAMQGDNTAAKALCFQFPQGALLRVECMRIDEMPKVEVVLKPTGGFWGGIGEPTIAVTAPAVLNGIFAATGKMPRTAPLKNIKLRDA